MRSPAAAFAWEFRQQHRWGFLLTTIYLFAVALIKLVLLRPGQLVTFRDSESFALIVLVPMDAALIYFLAVFTFGLAGDIAARRSIYPARMLTLPVTTDALAGLPMLYGTTAITLLWFATRALAAWPTGYDIPVIWPGLLAASMLAWTQALTWMSYPLPGMRIIVTILWLVVVDAIVMIALQFHPGELTMMAILSPHIPLAFLTARAAVRRARCGEIPDWRLERNAAKLRQRAPFSSAARAQTWFEWRRHGRSLPALVAILLPFELSMLFIFRETPQIVFETLAGVLLTPPFMGAFVAATVSKSSPHIATRPLTTAAMIAAKLKATIWSTLAAWLLIAITVPLALRLSGTLPMVMEWTHHLIEIVGTPRAIAMLLLGLLVLVASTWKQLVQGLFIGMTGRDWVAKASVFAALWLLSITFAFGHWVIGNHTAVKLLWNAFPSIAGALVLVKVSAAAWIAMRLHDRRLLTDRAIIIGAITWDVLVFALYGLLAWIFPALIIRHYLLALFAILAIPLVRLSAAPLAVAWNRHR